MRPLSGFAFVACLLVPSAARSQPAPATPEGQQGGARSPERVPASVSPVPPGHSVTLPPGAPPGDPAAPKSKQRWYGWQTLIVDGASAGAWLLGLGLGTMAIRDRAIVSGSAYVAGGVGYLLAAPMVHWAHDHVGKGFSSLGLRFGAALAGLTGGALLRQITGDKTPGTAALIAHALAAASVPVVLDAAVLAREKEQIARPSITPLLMPQRGGAALGLAGWF